MDTCTYSSHLSTAYRSRVQLHTSPFKKLRSVWQTEVKSTFTRTSRRPGGATSTSSITSGSPGPHATAAAHVHTIPDSSIMLPAWRKIDGSIEQGGGRRTGGRKKKNKPLQGNIQHIIYIPLHLMGFPRVEAPFAKLLWPLAAMVSWID